MLDFRVFFWGWLVFLLALWTGCGGNGNSFVVTQDSNLGVSPSVEPLNGQLVVAEGGNLFRVDRQGLDQVQLTEGFLDSDPHIHPQGSSIVFARRGLSGGLQGVFRIAPDGSQVTNLTSDFKLDAYSPDFSSDGTQIAFAAGDRSRQIFVMNADGSALRALTEGQSDDHPSFSSDGRFVVFHRAFGSQSKICKVAIEGGAVAELTDGSQQDMNPFFLSGTDTVLFLRGGQLWQMDDDHHPDDIAGLSRVSPVSLTVLQASHAPDGGGIFLLARPSVLAQTEEKFTLWHMDDDGTGISKRDGEMQAESLALSSAKTQSIPPNEVQVELVNDSGLPDDQVFVLLQTPQTTNQRVTGPLKLLTNSGSADVSGAAVPMSSLGSPTKTLVSTFTKETRSIYSLAIQNLVSGQLNVSYHQPVEIQNGASPTAQTPYRFDKMEITYIESARGGGGNLTSIDFYGIPIQVEVFHQGQTRPDPLQTKTFYASTPTLLKTLAGLGSEMNSGDGWCKTTSGTTFDPNNSDFSAFARVLSPNTIAAADTPQARPTPYPSFENYLASLSGQTFQLNGAQHGGYSYTATVQSDGNGGYDIVCRGTTREAPGAPAHPDLDQLAPNLTVTVHFPKGQAGPPSDPAKSMDFFTYACVANKDSYSIEGFPFTGPDDAAINRKVGYANSTAYGSIVGDVQAALNFGYPDSNFVAPGEDVDAMFGSPVVLPYPFPFGGARVNSVKADDGFYNPYASIFYYLSDSYGHPYSDRLDAASPLYTLRAGDTVRVTFLPDVRLDAPRVSVTGSTADSLSLSWQAVPNATSYSVSILPETVDTKVVEAGTSVTLTGLSPGVPYLVTVVANGVGGISSNSLPVQGLTAGARSPLAAGPANFQMSLNLPNNMSNLSDMEILIDGQPVGTQTNADFNLAFGTHVLDLQIRSRSRGTVVYRNNYFVDLDAIDPAKTHFGFGLPLMLQYNLLDLAVSGIGKGPNDPQPANGYPLTGNGLVLGTPFTPKPFYRFFPTVFPDV